MPDDDPGSEPDARFTYANERTFLAWSRTALALIVTGVAATQFFPDLSVEFGRRLLGLPLIALGALVAILSYREWQQRQRAMRLEVVLSRSHIPTLLTAGISVVAAIAVVLAVIEN